MHSPLACSGKAVYICICDAAERRVSCDESNAMWSFRLVTDDLQQPTRMPRSWQLMILSMIARLSAANADSMPAGSDRQLAAIIAHCRSVVSTQHTARGVESYVRALAYRALLNALLAVGALHKVLRHSPHQQKTLFLSTFAGC